MFLHFILQNGLTCLPLVVVQFTEGVDLRRDWSTRARVRVNLGCVWAIIFLLPDPAELVFQILNGILLFLIFYQQQLAELLPSVGPPRHSNSF